MDGVGGGYDKCMYVEPPGEVDINYKHTQIKLVTFTQNLSKNQLIHNMNKQTLYKLQEYTQRTGLQVAWYSDSHAFGTSL